MNKNLRVGKIKYVPARRGGVAPMVLVDVLEDCEDNNGNQYDARYNWWVLVDEQFSVKREDVGKWVEIGVYIQSFRDKSMHDKYDTVLKMRSLRFLENETEARAASRRISNSILTVN